MENLAMQTAMRRNRQKRDWNVFLKKITGVLEVSGADVHLLDASESLRFERELFGKSRAGFADGSIKRITDIAGEQIESSLAGVLSSITIDSPVIVPVNSLDFIFFTLRVPTSAQICKLLALDGESIFVAQKDLKCGLGVDLYRENNIQPLYEIDIWTNLEGKAT
jgi:hypothetical protein